MAVLYRLYVAGRPIGIVGVGLRIVGVAGTCGAGDRMDKIGRIWWCAVSGGVPKRSFVVAVIVGTVLNLINQGDVLIAGMPVDLLKVLLTYLVPYCVSTYGAVSYRLHAARLAQTKPTGAAARVR